MKTLKILPVLAAAMLLSACQMGGVNVSKPKLAKEGSAAEAKDVRKEFLDDEMKPGEAIKDLEYFKEDATVTSKEEKQTVSLVMATKETLDKKEISKTEIKQVTSVASQLDVNNKVAKTRSTQKAQTTSKTLYGKSSGSSSSESVGWMQEGTVKKNDKDVEGILGLDEKAKTYDLEQEFSEYFKKDEWTKFYVQQTGQSVVQSFYAALPSELLPEEEAKLYSCFKNGNIYTVKYAKEDEKPVELKDLGAEEAYAEKVTKLERTTQLEINGNKLVFKSISEQTVTTTYKLAHSQYGESHQKGAVVVEETKSYNETVLNDSKASLKVQDLSKYTYIG